MGGKRIGLTLCAGAAYFALVFAAGFVLGTVRVALLEPRLGARWAELLELPLMVAASYLAAGFVVRRAAVPAAAGIRLAVGSIALALMLAAELGVATLLRGMTLTEAIAERDPIAGGAYALALLVYAAMPWWRMRLDSAAPRR